MSDLFRLLIADKYPCILEGIENVLKEDQTIEIVGQATTFTLIDDYCREYQPHMLVVSLNLLPSPFIEAAGDLLARYPSTKLLIYLDAHDTLYFQSWLDIGISGCVLKEEPVDEVWMAIQVIHSGGTYFSRPALAKLMQSEDSLGLNILTEREKEVLQLMAQGMSNQQIADHLSIACRTVSFHTTNIYDKLGGFSRTETVAWAWKNGLMDTNIT